ncbi:hypothetical protein [Daejeonella sp.]|uniref:hypothetical protein n=1 Tax=Daejeonella sp. TaxID=2805397 RepID=UPI00271B29A0|nr:hypothetical protein [Daejeonella sp.]MDO8994533.1 hypothetical protein [Daejeonella sp.]MDP2414969.1 hypothetical protein [Daejeonella sp.]
MNLQQINLKQIMPTVLIFGLTGGALLILSTMLSNKGWWSIPIYAIVMIVTVIVLKAEKRFKIAYLKAFLTLVLTFMLMTYILYFYIITFVNPDNGILLVGHAWIFFIMLGLAITSGAIMGLFFLKTNNRLTNIQSS